MNPVKKMLGKNIKYDLKSKNQFGQPLKPGQIQRPKSLGDLAQSVKNKI